MNARRALLAAMLLASAALAVWGDRTPTGGPLGPMASGVVSASRSEVPARATRPDVPGVPELQPREGLVGGADASAATARAAPSLFAGRDAVAAPAPAASAPSAPVAPPLPFTYVGKQVQDEVWQVFLQRDGGDAIVVKEGDELAGLYRIESIRPPSMVLLYLPLHQAQALVIE